jgi:hypothetical protein
MRQIDSKPLRQRVIFAALKSMSPAEFHRVRGIPSLLK